MLAVTVSALAGFSASAAPRPASSGGGRAYFLVTLSGSIKAGSDSTASGGMVDNKTSLTYRWGETLEEAVAVSTGKPLARSATVAGKGGVQIDVTDQRTFGENHSLSCGMSLSPDARGVRAREPLQLAFDPTTRTATASGLMPFNLVNAVYSGPPQLNGLAPPCYSAHPYDWMSALAIPLEENPQVAPFKPLSCDLGSIGSSCKEPFSIAMTWPSPTGSSSLTFSASLVAKRVARPPADLARKIGR